MTGVATAVILARGLGTRMRALGTVLDAATAAVADTGVKALIPIDRPFLDYVLHDLAEAGITRVVLVIGPEHAALRAYCANLNAHRLHVVTAVQVRPLGTADAVLAAEGPVQAAGTGGFLVINGDNHYPAAALRSLAQFGAPGLVGFRRSGLLAGPIPAARITRFAAITADPEGYLRSIVEKPSDAQVAACGSDPLLSMNCWSFDATIFAACRRIAPSSRGELELPDAVMASQRLGTRYRILESSESVLDLSSREDIASVRSALMGTPVRL
jgi:glucose-1-phosphate thymidylyltransferase